MPIYQVSPTKWTNKLPSKSKTRSNLPLPYIISDEMPLTEQVDGRFYSSKAKFRAVGRALGLTEVGTERPKPRIRPAETRTAAEQRKNALKTAIAKYGAGHRARSIRGD